MEYYWNKYNIRRLIDEGGMTRRGLALAIEEITLKPCSESQVKNWLSGPTEDQRRALDQIARAKGVKP